jgi:deazaflavin-dependent oxidoreductase (nitroreductase family)
LSGDADSIGEQLVGWGKVALLETRGRMSGRVVRTPVGYVEGPDASLLVAAGEPDADWALNLLAERHCRVTIADRAADHLADLLEHPAERAAALSALILKYGTPAERLGRGPVFRLRPLDGR